jgi:hypothetical protein
MTRHSWNNKIRLPKIFLITASSCVISSPTPHNVGAAEDEPATGAVPSLVVTRTRNRIWGLQAAREKEMLKVRLMKMFGLAALAAIAAMAFIGAGSASAGSTALCKNSSLPCNSIWGTGTEIHGKVVGTSLLLSSLVNVHCNSQATGEITSAGLPANKQPVSGVMHIAFTGCKTTGGTACDNILDEGALLVLKTAAGLADVTVHDVLGRVHCGAFIDCSYVSAGIKGHGLNLVGANGRAHITFNKVKLTSEGGFFCPSESFIDVLYAVAALDAGVEKNIHISS